MGIDTTPPRFQVGDLVSHGGIFFRVMEERKADSYKVEVRCLNKTMYVQEQHLSPAPLKSTRVRWQMLQRSRLGLEWSDVLFEQLMSALKQEDEI